ncbi:MAG: GWxTD domain-containing protein [Bacteroidetes bacterium]|nr:GWxTD domain-containing protein [Bacteroidota bacterium]
MKKSLKIILLFILLTSQAFAVKNIYFNFDYALYKGESNTSILELYYSVNQNSLKHEKGDNGFEGAAMIDISIQDLATKEFIISNTYKTPSSLSDTSRKSASQKLVGQLNYVLKPGKYKLKITGSDFNNSDNQDVFESEISVTGIENSGITLSEIELATKIRKSENVKSVFYKNTLEVIPNPSNLFGMNLSEMYYYCEIYGLTPENISEKFSIEHSVLDLNNKVLISKSKDAERNGADRVDYGIVSIDSLSSGTYILRITVTDPSRSISFSSEKKFYIFNNTGEQVRSDDKDDFLRSEFASKSESDVTDEFQKMAYVMSSQEISNFEKLNNLQEKRKYLYSFWKTRESATGKPYTKIKSDYFTRVKEADKNYKESFKDGWKSDRGRIYIVYGKPDDIERYPFQAATKSYEIWKYNSVEGGGECVFVELQPGTDVYWLVNSTFRNELRNDNWESQLR